MVIVIALYLPNLGYQYVFDDRLIFISSRRLREGWQSVANIATPVIANTTYFRPAVLLSFVAEFSLFDAVPKISKSIGLTLHLANSVLVCLLAKRYFLLGRAAGAENTDRFGANVIALLGMLFYALHPALIESVAWVSGRFDLAVTLFSLLTLYVASDSSRVPPKFGVAALILLALLSKEMAITLPFLVVLFRAPWYCGTDTKQGLATPCSDAKLIVAMLCSVLIYLAARAMVHPQMVHVDSVVVSGLSSPLAFLLFVGRTLLFYVQLVVYPYRDTNPLHPFDSDSLDKFEGINVLAMGALLFFVLLPVLAWRYRQASLWLWLAFPISLLPVLNIIPLRLSGGIGENRFLTLPLAIFVIVLGYSAARLANQGLRSFRLIASGAFVAAALLVVANAAFLRSTLPIWRNDFTLFRSTFMQYPYSGRAAVQYLRAAFQEDRLQQALADIEASPAAAAFPQTFQAVYAASLAQVGRREEAQRNFEQAITRLDADGLGNMEAFRWYAESMQAWGMVNEAGAMLERVRVLQWARRNPDDDYYVAILELRQRILAGQMEGYADEIKALRSRMSPELYGPFVDNLDKFTSAACQQKFIPVTSPFCLGRG